MNLWKISSKQNAIVCRSSQPTFLFTVVYRKYIACWNWENYACFSYNTTRGPRDHWYRLLIFSLYPCAQRFLKDFSESFDIMCCWWDIRDVPFFTLRNIILNFFYNLQMQFFVDWWNLLLRNSDLLLIILISCKRLSPAVSF